MPRPRPQTRAALVASAANVTDLSGARPRIPKTGANGWQTQAWDYYDIVGELRFAASWLGQAMSRVRLVIKRRTDDGEEDVDDGPAVEALAQLFGGETGQSQMLNTLGIHLTVPGESYLVGEPGSDEPDEWYILSNEELTRRGQAWLIDRGDGKKRPLDAKGMVIRVWRPHPRRYLEATSSVRAVLPVLMELEQLTKHVAATIDSRLAGAGVLFVPEEMSFVTPDGSQGGVGAFQRSLTDAMLTPIGDRGDASAVVPITVSAPAAVLASVQHVTFTTPFDAQAQSLREEAIRRLALGMDLPAEVMLGTGDTNHWSSWQIEESALKVHVEPMCELVSDALTSEWLHPVLKGQGADDDDLFVFADTSDLRLRPDHSQSALELYDRLELSGDALRRESGFEDGDAPEDDALIDILTKKIALGNSADAMAAAKLLGLELPDETPPTSLPVGGVGQAPAIEQDPENVRALPQQPIPTEDDIAAAVALVAARLAQARALR